MGNRLDKIEKLRYLLRSINQQMNQYFTAYLQKHNVTLPQLLLLREVYRNDSLSLNELSQKLGLANSTVCGIVNRLEKRDLVARKRDENDRRVVRVSITPKTQESFKSYQTNLSVYLMKLTHNITESEIDQIIYSLSILQQELIEEI